jgi:predicted RNase H-like HicB family nuclease
MNSKINIQIEKTETGYFGYSPDIEDSQIQGDSYENILDAFKLLLGTHLGQQENQTETRADRPIWEIAQDITKDMTEDEIRALPSDGAEQHDHYIYGVPKRSA